MGKKGARSILNWSRIYKKNDSYPAAAADRPISRTSSGTPPLRPVGPTGDHDSGARVALQAGGYEAPSAGLKEKAGQPRAIIIPFITKSSRLGNT